MDSYQVVTLTPNLCVCPNEPWTQHTGLSWALCSVIPTCKGIISVAFVRSDVISLWTKRKLTQNQQSKSPLNCTFQILHRFERNISDTEWEACCIYMPFIVALSN